MQLRSNSSNAICPVTYGRAGNAAAKLVHRFSHKVAPYTTGTPTPATYFLHRASGWRPMCDLPRLFYQDTGLDMFRFADVRGLSRTPADRCRERSWALSLSLPTCSSAQVSQCELNYRICLTTQHRADTYLYSYS
jgi:hypothetical protein